MKTRMRRVVVGLALAAGLCGGAWATAAPAEDGGGAAPPPAPREGPPPPRRDGNRRPPGPVTVQRAIEELNLTDEQKQKAGPLLEAYRQKEREAREELVRQLAGVLDERQSAQLRQALRGEGHPPRPDGNRDGSSPPAAEAASPRAAAGPAGEPAPAPGETRRAVTFTGGHDTDPRDHGRPVVLVAAGLGVPPEVFREAFSRVTPAGPGQEPDPAQVRRNKQALMSRLGPLGVTNERLDEVSNYYRYSSSRGQTWRSAPAAGYATVRDGVVTGIAVTEAGAGYSSPPQVTVEGMPEVKAAATLWFGTDLATNGSVKEVTLKH